MQQRSAKNQYKTGLLLLLCFSVFCLSSKAQIPAASPTTALAHAHNDYLQKLPFWLAYKAGFGSIETDVFLRNQQLMVAHEAKEITAERTLEALYLKPLQEVINKNKGAVYADSSRRLQLMIDLNTTAETTLNPLINLLQRYPELTGCASLQLVITGSRPAAERFSKYPSWLFFDGVLDTTYSPASLARVALFSDNFKKHSRWNGKGMMPDIEKKALSDLVEIAHRQHKKIRFWNAPDLENSWHTFLDMGIDWINTDHIKALTDFLTALPQR